MDVLIQIVLSGMVVGCVYGMAALGFTIVYNATKLINFANGEFLMLGGVVLAGVGTILGVPVPAAVFLGIVVTAAVALVLQRLLLDNVRSADPLALIMMTIGASVALRGAASLVFGREVAFVPEFGGMPMLLLGDIYVSSQGLWIVTTLVAVSAALWYLFSRTLFGKAMRAASQEPRAAALCGIEPRHAAIIAMVMAGAIGGLAGAFLAPLAPASYENGIFLGLKGFAAAVAGGLGNPFGAVAGGILIGVVESVTAGYVSSGMKDAIAFLMLLLVLIFRPQGLVGKATVSRV